VCDAPSGSLLFPPLRLLPRTCLHACARVSHLMHGAHAHVTCPHPHSVHLWPRLLFAGRHQLPGGHVPGCEPPPGVSAAAGAQASARAALSPHISCNKRPCVRGQKCEGKGCPCCGRRAGKCACRPLTPHIVQ